MSTKVDPNLTQSEVTPLPSATPHKAQMCDCPLTLTEYADHLAMCHDRLSWLHSLFTAIQSDEDVEEGFQVFNLAQIGEHLAGIWLGQLNVRRQSFDTALASPAT